MLPKHEKELIVKGMTVKDLIEFLQQQPQDLLVVAYCYKAFNTFITSEHVLLEKENIKIKELCYPRPDGWIHDKQAGSLYQKYLVFPGN